jgi:hypothetical protein
VNHSRYLLGYFKQNHVHNSSRKWIEQGRNTKLPWRDVQGVKPPTAELRLTGRAAPARVFVEWVFDLGVVVVALLPFVKQRPSRHERADLAAQGLDIELQTVDTEPLDFTRAQPPACLPWSSKSVLLVHGM